MPNRLSSVTVVGGPYLLSEVAEQIAWLAASLQIPCDNKLVAQTPRLENIYISSPLKHKPRMEVSGNIVFHKEESQETLRQMNGSCWVQLLPNAVMVHGYPILRQMVTKSGLQTSLGVMASLVRSTHIVRYEDRVVNKCFGFLMIATSHESETVVWHALLSSTTGEHISYFDTQIDALRDGFQHVPSLRILETARHIVGWCSHATDFCGKLSSRT
jgi:hypothetical protein